MQINLTPVRADSALIVHVAGDVLTLNGVPYDFGPLPEGGILPRAAVDCPWLASDVTRQSGQLALTLILPHGFIPYPAPIGAAAVLFPAPINVTTDGPVDLPSFDGEADE